MPPVYILMTMDCESAHIDVSKHGRSMSSSGPADYEESERSIRGFVETIEAAGYPATLLLHPEVAAAHSEMLLDVQSKGTCLGLHLHPYKLVDSAWQDDLGSYTTEEQRKILSEAIEQWERALGQKPAYFRAGYFSANDATFRVLEELGFRGGSLSNPGRRLATHFSIWGDAESYPHRANTAFRSATGDSELIEVPVAVAYGRPVAQGHAGEAGYEWPYIPHTYDHGAVIENIFSRFIEDQPRFGTYVTDTHNDHDYSDPTANASRNLRGILAAIESVSASLDLEPVGITLDALCDQVREETK
ncbi:MAG: hypothetical protein CME19_02945 [Gemmatimonadetes bacterium]|nr:hypothetical protein [Gemmatimonadota bacterium]